MSQRPFGFNNRTLRENYSYERAAPRVPGQGEKRYHHPVIPISSKTAPHYAQASQLYPMRTNTEPDNAHRYKPGSGSLGSPSGRPASPSGVTRQAVNIPVLHMAPSRATGSSPVPLSSYGSGGGGSPIELSHSNPATPTPPPTLADAMSDSGSYRGTPTFRTASHLGTQSIGQPASSTPSSSRHAVNRGQPIYASDQEAEVDALTNLLMQSMETRSSSASALGNIGGSAGSDGQGSTPGFSIRRGSGSSNTPNLNSQIGRLQQHLGLTSSPVGGVSTNSGRGSPLAVGNPSVSASSITGSNSSANSPTGSTTSMHNITDTTGMSLTSHPNALNNNCFRCNRALVPQEGSTLNQSVAMTNCANNIVTLTGALAVRLHVACFTCYRCKAPLRPDAYYHGLRRLLCPACVRDGTVEHCANCRRPIGERVVHALGMPYHPNCFVCVVCASRLDSRPFTIDVHGRLHCLDDFHRRYAPRCADCSQPIVPEPGTQEAKRVVSGDSNYHLECFGYHAKSPTQGGSATGASKMTTNVVS